MCRRGSEPLPAPHPAPLPAPLRLRPRTHILPPCRRGEPPPAPGRGCLSTRVQSNDGGSVVTAWLLAIGRMLGLGSIAGIRPSLTLAVIGVVSYFDWGVETNSTFSWLSHWLAIGIFVVLAILESTFDKISKLDRLQDRLIMPYRLFMGGDRRCVDRPVRLEGHRGRRRGRRRRRLVRAVHQAPLAAQERAERGREDAHQRRARTSARSSGACSCSRCRTSGTRASASPGSCTGGCATGGAPSTGRCAAPWCRRQTRPGTAVQPPAEQGRRRQCLPTAGVKAADAGGRR